MPIFKKNGFTLVEVLTALAVISVLTGIIIVILNPTVQLKKARDTKRKFDIEEIRRGLGLYVYAEKSYPPEPFPFGEKPDQSPLKEYFTTIPQDPLKGQTYTYKAFPKGCNGTSVPCTSYILEAIMEGKTKTVYQVSGQRGGKSIARLKVNVVLPTAGPTQQTFTSSPSEAQAILPPQLVCDEKTVAFWHLDEAEGSGAYLKDTCNNNHATPQGAVYVQGKINGGRSFDGQNDDVVANNEANFDFTKDEPITIEAWIYPTNLYNNRNGIINNRDQIVTKGHDEGNRNFEFSVAGLNNGTGQLFFGYKPHISWDDLGSFIFDYYNSTSYQIYSSNDPIIKNNNWYHVAIVYKYRDPDSAKFYVNGTEVAGSWVSGNGKISPEPNNDYPVMIGAEVASAVNERFDGIIDEVRISKGLRSAAEIKQSYLLGSGGATPVSF